MNWTDILARAGIQDSPGRAEAVTQALASTAARKAALEAQEQAKKAAAEKKKKGRGR